MIGKKLCTKCGDSWIEISHWKEPKKKELPIGIFISQYLKTLDEDLWKLE